MTTRLLPVPDGLHGQRADSGVAKMLGLSRSQAAAAADAGGIVLDGRVLAKSDALVAGGILEVTWSEPRPLEVVPVVVDDLGIVYDDDDLVVVDKPAGVAAHPSLGWDGPTVPGALAAAGYRIATSGAAERQGIVHRLDVGTSGLMVVAKSEHAYSELKRQFHDREVDKIYLALAQGYPDPSVGTIDAPIARDTGARWRFAVRSDGKHAVTHYETLEAFLGASLLRVALETGRTHQIRVHFASQRHPLVGDTTYGADPTFAAEFGLERPWLHAHQLSFDHPDDGRRLSFESMPSPDLAAVLADLAAR